MTRVTFITGNQNKADYLARLLGMEIDHQKVDLDEIQAHTVAEVVEHKVRQAYEIVKKPVLVDDVGLGFEALSGLPGPFVKFFVESSDGLEKLCRMLDGFDTRRATGTCTQGYYDGTTLKLFTGQIHGEITQHPRGENGFSYGWDAIFCPDGYGGRTRAELTAKEYDEVYEQIRPFVQVREFLQSIS